MVCTEVLLVSCRLENKAKKALCFFVLGSHWPFDGGRGRSNTSSSGILIMLPNALFDHVRQKRTIRTPSLIC